MGDDFIINNITVLFFSLLPFFFILNRFYWNTGSRHDGNLIDHLKLLEKVIEIGLRPGAAHITAGAAVIKKSIYRVGQTILTRISGKVAKVLFELTKVGAKLNLR